MNVVGNEITNTGFLLGLYQVNGTGHYTFGNNVNGTINPSNTSVITETSLFLNGSNTPAFLSGSELPLIAYPNEFDQTVIPASERYDLGQPVNCNAIVTSITQKDETADEWLRFTQDGFLIDSQELPTRIEVHDLNGKLIEQLESTTTNIKLNKSYPSGIYLINAVGRKSVQKIKVLILR
jgi:hypothetical protein